MKKDNYLQALMAAPPKQKMQIQFIDPKTLREGFSVTLTGLPSYNKASLEGTDPKEKEAKKLKVRLPSLSAGRRTSLAWNRRSGVRQRKRKGSGGSSGHRVQVPTRPRLLPQHPAL